MKVKIIIALIGLLYFGPLSGQQVKNQAYNVRQTILEDRVEIRYELPVQEGARYQVYLKAKKSDIELISVEGTGSDLNPHKDMVVSWNFTADNLTYDEVKNLKVELTAVDLNDPVSYRNALLTGVGFGAVGIGLVAGGTVTMSNAKNSGDYQTYQQILDKAAPVWTELGYDSRDALYANYNNKYKTGQIILGAGAVVLATGAFLVARAIKKNKDYVSKLEDSALIYPILDFRKVSPAGPSFQNLGFGLCYRF